MDQWIVGVNLFAVCLTLALVEVHIEGAHGWAAKLPTWRIDKPWIRKLTNGKPITGYHVYINLVILTFIHFPLILSQWTLVGELRVMSQYLMIAVYWDFLWFVTNPHFGLRRFKSANIWWHHKWVLGIMPWDYVTGTAASAALWLLADWREPGPMTFGNWGILVGVIVGLTAVTALVAEIIRPRKREQAPDSPIVPGSP